MKALATALLLFVVATALASAAEDPRALFASAKQAYDKHEYTNALSIYNRLADQQWSAPELYFNRGNTLARLGETGNAIANYEMALLLNPRDADAVANLKFLRSTAGIPAPPSTLLKRLFASLSGHEWALAAQMAWWLMAALLALFWLTGSRLLLLRQGVATMAVVLALAIAGFAHSRYAMRHPNVVVTKEGIQALFAPLPDATPHFVAPEGMTLRLLDQTGAWLRVQSGKETGWIPADACFKVELAK